MMTRSGPVLTVVFVLALGLFAVRGQELAGPAGETMPLPRGAAPAVKQTHILHAPNAEANDHFACGGGNQGHRGDTVAFSRDGNTMVVGAPYESSGARGIDGDQRDNSLYASGAVYVYTRQGGAWTPQAYLKASNAGTSDLFGSSVAISADGNTLAVAAYFESGGATGVNGNQDDDSIPQAGAVYVFTRSGTTWTQQAYLKASNTGKAGDGDNFGDGDQFGYSVAVSGDGNTVAVGAVTEDSNARGINGNQADDSVQSSGAVYVYARSGATWTQQAYIKSSNAEAGDLFGFATALDFDGDTLVASGFDERGGVRTINGPQDDNTANGSGALYVFVRTGATWTQQAYVKGSRTEATDQLGYSVSISDDGNTIASGAGDEDCLTPGINPPGCDNDSPPRGAANIWVGAAYVFVRNGTTWSEQAFIKANNARPYNSFGVKLALSRDGNTLAVASYLEDNAGHGVHPPVPEPFLVVDHLDPWREHQKQALESGAVYLYTRAGTTWTQQAYIKGSDTEAGHEFGSAVALSGDGKTMAIGAHNAGEGAGAVYMFAQ